MEQTSQIVGPVVNILTTHIAKQLGYVTSSSKYVRDMSNKMTVLEGKRVDVEKHKHANIINNKETPARVEGWLGDVENVKKEVQSISSNVIGCLNIKMRYRLGRNAFNTIKEIERLISEEIYWRDANIPVGRVNSESVSWSAPSASGEITQSDFKSRDKTFKDALRFLQQDDKTSQVIALCGMGGVGKTTMMEQLKTVAHDKKMFDWIVKVVIGNNPNMLSIQNDIALCTGEVLPEATKAARAEHLCRRFKKILEDGKNKILVILDDVWEKVELKDIGLTVPLPNGVKLLLTSRDSNICTQIAASVDLVLRLVSVDVLEEAEAQGLFSQITGLSKEDDQDLYQIGCDIVKKCGRLPLAIKLIGTTLKHQENFIWRTTLNRLRNNDLDANVQEIIKISYEHIKYDEDKEIFMHCGLFPEDYNIPIEHLTRYAWGLKLLRNVFTLSEARDRTYTCVRNLINANLLINSDHPGCVKMHDLVLAFVLGRVSKGDPTWIINHSDMSKWGRDELSKSCSEISLTCRGMSEFPRDFKYVNLSLLQLMHGDLLLNFRKDFYENFKNLEVIAYYRMQYPLLPRSFQCSTHLRVLLLHECQLMFDYDFVGDLVNLEVLSFAHCGIHKLPSAIGNLRKLKLLDLTGCVDLHIDDGTFKNLHNLEELYMRVGDEKVVRFTEANFEELKMLSSQLCALEVEFVEKKTWMKNVSFKKLVKFKISIGCLFEVQKANKIHSFENTLKLVTSCNHLLDFKISELFKKTEKLHLQVEDMSRLEDVSHHPYNQHSFSYLKDLVISGCPKLKYLFPVYVASGLRKLERLKVSSCSVLEALVHGDGSEINSESELIKFELLNFLSLRNLPKLVCMFLIDHAVDLPQLVELEVDGLPNFTSIYSYKDNISTFLNSKVNISELKKLKVKSMKNLEQILDVSNQSGEVDVSNISMLREIEVAECDSLMNLFPTNPMRLLKHLEKLEVDGCGSIEVIFSIDLGCVGEVEEVCNSSLRTIKVTYSEKVRGVWSIKYGEFNSSSSSSIIISSIQAVESIKIKECKMFRNVFIPNNKFDMRAVEDIIYECGESGRNKEQEFNVTSNKEIQDVVENGFNVVFPSYLIPTFQHQLSYLSLSGRVNVVFEMRNGEPETPQDEDTEQQILLFPHLKDLSLSQMETLTHVWKCDNWNKFSVLHKQSSFRSLTTIYMYQCDKIKYLFSPLMAKLLSNLKTIEIYVCGGLEEVVSKRDDKDEEMATSTTTSLFPLLHSLTLRSLKNLKRIGGGGKIKVSKVVDVSWSLCQYSKVIRIDSCHALSSAVPSYAIGQMQNLQELQVIRCGSMLEVFETQGINKSSGGSNSTKIDEGNGGAHTTTLSIPKIKNVNVSQLSGLKKLRIGYCNRLHHVFTFSTLESLRQLEELGIWRCKSMEVIVKKENGEQRKVVVFPRLKSLELVGLPNLNGFFLGMNDFQWSLLEKVTISQCPQMIVFTSGQSMAPELKYIHTSLGKHTLDSCGLNFHVTRDLHQTILPSSEHTSGCSTTLERLPWSFHNLIEIDMLYNEDVKSIIPFNELLHLQKLERIQVRRCANVEEVFEVEAMEEELGLELLFREEEEVEVFEGRNSESQTQTLLVQIPNLTQLELIHLSHLKYIWKSNHHLLEFPNLTTLFIQSCHVLKHVFTRSMVVSMQQLQDLYIGGCKNLKVIVKEEEESECDAKVNETLKLPCLKSLKLESLRSLEGFFLGKGDFSFPSLHTLEINECPEISVFTKGNVAAPALHVIDTSFGRCCITEDINSFIKTKQNEGFRV
ncbi:putative P-loop containing nucleoside triphosphate hydrolase, leucine-rich repeat domain superfamily [Helianthus annuus]|nr:putative P-loop containing nucleoside triphosphate hydrolase, leucine-rich repeat domain superfamily [Helianthus annuus]